VAALLLAGSDVTSRGRHQHVAHRPFDTLIEMGAALELANGG